METAVNTLIVLAAIAVVFLAAIGAFACVFVWKEDQRAKKKMNLTITDIQAQDLIDVMEQRIKEIKSTRNPKNMAEADANIDRAMDDLHSAIHGDTKP